MKTKKHILKKACGKGGPIAMGKLPYGRMSYPDHSDSIMGTTSAPSKQETVRKLMRTMSSAPLKNFKVSNMVPYIKPAAPKVTVGAVVREVPGVLKGMDKNAVKAVDPGNIVGKAGGMVKGAVKNYLKKNDEIEAHKVKENTKMIEDNWGSVENYKKLQGK